MMSDDNSNFAPVDPLQTGLKGRCPRCAEGQLFDGFLGLKKTCYNCHLDFDFADAGDGPAVLVMTLVGFIVVGLALWMEVNYGPPLWLQLLLWIPLAIGLGLYLLRIMKGIVICIQFKNKAQQGELDRDE
jgi:uncharacterized protein (DUF983 family)